MLDARPTVQNYLRVPVTILTGYLGAGKTTTLNSLLQQCGQMRVGIIENEFGDIGIDNQLVEGVDEQLIALTNGCMCCTVRGDLIKILHRWLDEGRVLDRIVIETTGIADPGPIAETFAADPRLWMHFSLDAVITVVDAVNIHHQFEEGIEAQRQVAYADWLVINKVELVDAERLSSVEALVGKINPLATFVKIMKSRMADLTYLFTARSTEAALPSPTPAAHHHEHGHGDIGSVSFQLDGSLNAAQFYRWMGDVLGSTQGQLLRAKGILAFAGEDNRVVLQGVRDVITFSEGTPWRREARRSQLVLIGRHIVEAANHIELSGCAAHWDDSPRATLKYAPE